MERKPLIILVSGKLGSGKTTFANKLQAVLTQAGYYTIKMAFADEVKRIAKEEFDWDGKKNQKGRRLLQVIGTEAGRAYDEDIWVKKLVKNLEKHISLTPPSVVIIDDWRFPNEYQYLVDQGYEVFTVRINPAVVDEKLANSPEYNHVSEKALDGFVDYDMFILNYYNGDDFDGPIAALRSYVQDKIDYWQGP